MLNSIRLITAATLVIGSSAFAASTKAYQVTGPVTAVDETSYTVQKGKESWIIQKDVSTPASPEVKVGDKVTISYKMVATKIEEKGSAKTEAKTETKTTTKTEKK